MAEVTDLPRRKPRRLSETVYTDIGSRLASPVGVPARPWFWLAAIVVLACAIGLLFWMVAHLGASLAVDSHGPQYMSPNSPWAKDSPAEQAAKRERSVVYSGCDDVRAAGAAPLYAGQPGYRPEMDGDGDGIACEPHRQ